MNQSEMMETKNCMDYCAQSFEGPEGKVVNGYKCNGRKLSASGLWNIQNNKRQVSGVTGGLKSIL